MNPLDGNAIAGPLASFFGTEMTTAEGSCRHCGRTSRVAELRVYASGPGTVARCPTCEGVLFVVTEIREQISVSSDGFAFVAGA
ncbi:MAG TPA: DUF6510 family protein [Solirubrobacteraceae bacterium]|nr:DUF6510 family protein [Solirubrobacteraceae bacterium]